MSFKHIFIIQKSYLSYQNNSLAVKNEQKETLISLDDIDMLIVENNQTTISSSLISHMAQKNISVMFVDEKFMPSAISHGLYKNSRTFKIQKAQLSVSKPRVNRLWKDIVSSKVLNQGDVAKDEYLYSLANKVQSADKTHIESIAAAYYFKKLFGSDFIRKNELDTRNVVLNYGYSIIRSSISRHIIAYGLNPSFGIWHSNELNAYNLADDLLEPFRPIVDRYVLVNKIDKNSIFIQNIKYDLVGLLYAKVKNNNGENIILNDAIKNIVASYQSFCLGKREDVELFFMTSI